MASKAPKMLSFYLATGLFGAFVTGQMSDPANDAQIIISGWNLVGGLWSAACLWFGTVLGSEEKAR